MRKTNKKTDELNRMKASMIRFEIQDMLDSVIHDGGTLNLNKFEKYVLGVIKATENDLNKI